MVATTSVSRKTDYLQVLSSCRELPPETEVCVLKTGSTGNRHSHCEGNTNSNLKKENVQLESKKNDLFMVGNFLKNWSGTRHRIQSKQKYKKNSF